MYTAFKDPCDHADYDKNDLLNLEEISSNSDNIEYVPPHMTFLDGISVAYFEAAAAVVGEEDTESYATDFSIGFNDCGCTCESFPLLAPPITDVPTFSPTTFSPTTMAPTDSPTTSPTKSPTESPTESPAIATTASPTASPTASLTASPTISPTASPTDSPTTSPTTSPTNSPTDSPITASQS